MSASDEFKPLKLAILTVSDTRSEKDDTSGDTLAELASTAGHQVIHRGLVKDDVYLIRAVLSRWIVDANVNAVLITGGTGFSGRDTTPEAVAPLLDKEVSGFGETFRALSFQEIGTSTIQSRALAGLANYTAIFCVPGSTGACKTAWHGVIETQLNSTHKPCNFYKLLMQKEAKDMASVQNALKDR